MMSAAIAGTVVGYLVSTHFYTIRVFEPVFAADGEPR
jgi:hypothetical protein